MPKAKSAQVLAQEKTSHRTKKELADRERAEQSFKTGREMSESGAVKNDPIAHATFKRVAENLSLIGQNNALFENVINRYCMIASDLDGLQKERAEIKKQQGELFNVDLKAPDASRLDCIEKQIQSYRKMMLDIERESLLTVQSASKQVPKKAKEDAPLSPLMQALQSGDE